MNYSQGPSEIHSVLLQDLENDLTQEHFMKLKNHCKSKEYGGFGAGQLEKIKTISELFERLKQKAIIKEGSYEKLKKLLQLCENESGISKVEAAERDLFDAGYPVVGYPAPGSDAAAKNFAPLATHAPPPYSSYMHQESYPSNAPQPQFGGFQTMMPGQHHEPTIHRSDAMPSMVHPHPSYHSGGNRMPLSPGIYNQPPGHQYHAQPHPLSPMQGVSTGHLSNPNFNQSCGSGNLQMMDNDDYYDMQGGGYILFINNFFKHARGKRPATGGTLNYEFREGADKDTGHIRNTVDNYLTNHHLDVEEEVGINKFWGILDDAKEKLKRDGYSSFILIISSHGIQKKTKDEHFKSEKIVLVDESEVSLEEIKDKFSGENAPFLNGKPKVFIVQACRGDEYGVAVPDKADCSGGPVQNLVSEQVSRPANADVLEAFATSSGTRAWRNSVEGTWYINHLCQAIIKNTERQPLFREHFLDLLVKVHNQISARVTNTANPAKQMPCYVTTFTKKFRLN